MTVRHLLDRFRLRYLDAYGPWSNLGDGLGSLLLPCVVRLLCAPSLLWSRSCSACMPVCGRCSNGNKQRPTSRLRWPACPTLPSRARSIPTAATGRRAEQIRADLKLISPYTQRDPHLFVDRRRRTRAGDRRRVRPEGHARHLDRQERGAQRARNPVGDRARPALPQHQRDRGRQRDHAARGQDRRRTRQDHPAGQAPEPGAGHHRRNLDGLDRPSGARLLGRFHRRSRPALLGRHPGRQDRSTRPIASTTSCATRIPASAS